MTPGPLARLRARQRAEERALVREALEAGAWTLFRAAQWLDVRVSTLQALLRRHRDLERERLRRASGRPAGPLREAGAETGCGSVIRGRV